MTILLMAVLLTHNSQSPVLNRTSVSGRIVDPTGQALVGTRVTISGPSAFFRETKSDAAGTFRFTDVTPGTYSLEVCCDLRVMPVTKQIVIGDRELRNVEMVAEPLLESHGRVNVIGPVAPPDTWYGARVEATSVTGKPRKFGATVRSNGTFVLHLPRGEYRVDLNTPDSYKIQSITLGGNDLTTENLRVETTSSLTIIITVATR